MQTTPDGYSTVAPWVVTDDTGASLDFVTHAFDGMELARVRTEGMRVAQETLDAELSGRRQGRSSAPVKPAS